MDINPNGKIAVVSPHVDDDLYGCGAFLISSKEPIDVYYVTDSEEQRHRFEVISALYSCNPNIHVYHAKLFADGSGALARDNAVTNGCQKFFDELACKYDTLLVNSDSCHQDHYAVTRMTDVAIRSRPALKVKNYWTYDYVYNVDFRSRAACKTYYYSQEVLDSLLDICEDFDKECKVTKDSTFVTDFHNAFKINEFIGSCRGYPFAEKFNIIFEDTIVEA